MRAMIAADKVAQRLVRPITIAVAVAALIAGLMASAGQAVGQEVRRFDLRIADGRLVSGLKAIRVRRNDTVEISWTADRPTTVHLHGYDIETKVDTGAAKTMSFRAHASGRFPIEVHGKGGRHAVLLYLEVHPR